MIINTLGPETTDSYLAATTLQQAPNYQNAQIQLHPSFESIYDHLPDYAGDYFLVPTAYRSQREHDSWTDNHYRYWQQLNVVDTFARPMLPLVLVENRNQLNHRLVLHAATLELANQFRRKLSTPLDLAFVQSKPLAQSRFMAGDFQYGIFSANHFQPTAGLKVRQTYQPQMVWCLYQIKD